MLFSLFSEAEGLALVNARVIARATVQFLSAALYVAPPPFSNERRRNEQHELVFQSNLLKELEDQLLRLENISTFRSVRRNNRV